MLYINKLEAQQPGVREAVEELFNKAFEKQTHHQDLLLVLQHGYLLNNTPVIGIGEVGLSKDTQYEFYDWYRKSFIVDYDDFMEKTKESDEYKEAERLSIQIEKIVYLKFWESDMILKTLKQLVSLANGKKYDWYLKIPTNPREGNKSEVIIKEIQNAAQNVCPKYNDLLKNTYSRELRNAIAHSQYFIYDRMIGYLNCKRKGLSFDDWGSYIGNTILLQNELIRSQSIWTDFYMEKTLKNGHLDVRVNKIENKSIQGNLKMRDGSKKLWVWE